MLMLGIIIMIKQNTIKNTYISHPCWPIAFEPHQTLAFCPFDPEADIYSSMQLVYLAAYPWYLARKVYLIAQYFPCFGVRPQRIQRAAHHRARLFLVVEDTEHRRRHYYCEQRQGLKPSWDPGRYGREGSVAPALHQRARARSRSFDKSTAWNRMLSE